MRMNTIRVMLTSAAVAIAFAITISQPIASAQNSSELVGTSWKLVKLQTGDDTTHVPDDGSKYTITFGRNGRATTRVDCNRASSTWRSSRPNELEFGSWSRTSAKCPPGSLHDKIVTEGAMSALTRSRTGILLSGMRQAATTSWSHSPLKGVALRKADVS